MKSLKIKNLKRLLIVVAVITLIFSTIMPSQSYAADESVIIQFKDSNFYQIVLDELQEDSEIEIESYNDTKKSIVMKQSEIDKVVDLNLVYDDTNDVSDISGIEKFQNLKSLAITGGRIITGISRDSSLKNIEPLKYLTNLNVLTLKQNKIEDISPIENLTNLSKLMIEGVPELDTTKLLKMTKLTSLKLTGCDIDDEDLESVSKLTGLKKLELGGENYEGNNIEDISPLSKLVNIEILSLSNNKIEDITALEQLKKMYSLTLRGNNISDLSPLKELSNITHLVLGRDNYGTGLPIDSAQLKNIPHAKLSYLGAAMCKLDDISELSKIPSLTGVDLTANEISDISPLNSLPKLTYAKLSMNHIRNLSSLNEDCINRLKSNVVEVSHQTYEANATAGDVIQLPDTFLAACTEGSIGYIKNLSYQYYNCTLSADRKSITINNEKSIAFIYVKGTGEANEGFYGTRLDVNVTRIDEEAPILNVEYSTKETTNGDVTVTITANEAIKEVAGFTLQGKTLTKVYSENTTEQIKVYDLAGNMATADIVIANIDKNKETEEATTEKATTETTAAVTTEKITTEKSTTEKATTEKATTAKKNDTTPKTGDSVKNTAIILAITAMGIVIVTAASKKKNTEE